MIVLEEGTQCTIDMEDGNGIVLPFNKKWGSFHFTGDPYGKITVVKDEFNDKRYEAATSDVNSAPATPVGDMAAVRAYLSGFVG